MRCGTPPPSPSWNCGHPLAPIWLVPEPPLVPIFIWKGQTSRSQKVKTGVMFTYQAQADPALGLRHCSAVGAWTWRLATGRTAACHVGTRRRHAFLFCVNFVFVSYGKFKAWFQYLNMFVFANICDFGKLFKLNTKNVHACVWRTTQRLSTGTSSCLRCSRTKTWRKLNKFTCSTFRNHAFSCTLPVSFLSGRLTFTCRIVCAQQLQHNTVSTAMNSQSTFQRFCCYRAYGIQSIS